MRVLWLCVYVYINRCVDMCNTVEQHLGALCCNGEKLVVWSLFAQPHETTAIRDMGTHRQIYTGLQLQLLIPGAARLGGDTFHANFAAGHLVQRARSLSL